MNQKIVFFLIALFIFLPAKTLFSQDKFIRVKILSRYALDEVQVFSNLGKIKIWNEKGQGSELFLPAEAPIFLQVKKDQLQLILDNNIHRLKNIQIIPPRGSFIKIKASSLEKKFFGVIHVRIQQGHLSFIEEIPLEDYVQGVLEAEMPNGFGTEALKAQAILIRTYAFRNENRHGLEGFDLCDLTHCQVYAGRSLNYVSHAEAVRATRGVMLAYNLMPAEVFYHSTCGGHTSAANEVFGGASFDYLKGVDDQKYCVRSPHSHWENVIPLSFLNEIFKKEKSIKLSGDLKFVSIAQKEKEGDRVTQIAFDAKNHVVISAQLFLSLVGKSLGWSSIKSAYFELEQKGDQIYFKGKGLGHGVGFCQWGAKGLAEEGKKFEEILKYYFPGTQLIQRNL